MALQHSVGGDAEFTTPIGLPLVLDDPEGAHWVDEADIVTIGFGGAAAVAGLQALEYGATVIAVDCFEGGGSTAISGGVIYAGGTRYQVEAGYKDTPDDTFKYLRFEGMAVKDETLRRYCDTIVGDMKWLSGFGIRFGSTVYKPSTAYPPDGCFLYFSGMEKLRPDVAYVAPRGGQGAILCDQHVSQEQVEHEFGDAIWWPESERRNRGNCPCRWFILAGPFGLWAMHSRNVVTYNLQRIVNFLRA